MITINPVKAKAIHNEKQRLARQAAFQQEHDPLVGQVLRGEIPESALVEKANEIRARFPYQD